MGQERRAFLRGVASLQNIEEMELQTLQPPPLCSVTALPESVSVRRSTLFKPLLIANYFPAPPLLFECHGRKLIFKHCKTMSKKFCLKEFQPGWCGSVDGVLACNSKDRRFDSQSGHTPGLPASSPVRGMQEATN